MLKFIFSLVVAGSVLLATEWFSAKKRITSELPRKIPHIAGSIVVAIWPLFISMYAIAAFALMFIGGVWVVVRLDLFAHARNVSRVSWGEYFYGLGVGSAALLHPSVWVFAAAMLHVGVADAAAALVGTRFGKHTYTIFGYTKSWEGSAAFFAVSALIITWLSLPVPFSPNINSPLVLVLPFLATMVEAVSQFGVDNLLIPLLVVIILSRS